MGFLDKLLRTMPGGPASVTKNLFTNYNKIKMRSPNLEDKEIFRELLESRYAVLKTIRKEQLDEIIETSDRRIIGVYNRKRGRIGNKTRRLLYVIR